MYKLQIERHAERDLKRLKKRSSAIFSRVISHISALKDNPRPTGVRKIVGSESDWRISIGDYRGGGSFTFVVDMKIGTPTDSGAY